MLLAIIAFVFAQDVELRPKLVPGDVVRLEITRSREDSRRPQMNVRSQTLVDIHVIRSGPDGFTLEWVPGRTVFDNPLVMQEPGFAAAAQAVQDIRFRILLNADGEYIGLANEAEITPKLQAAVNTIVQEAARNLPASQRQAFQNTVRQVLSPAVLAASATQDVQTYFGLNGAALAPGEEVVVPLEEPNPLGGGNITSRFRVRVDSATAEFAWLSTTKTFHPDTLRQMTMGLLQQAGQTIPPSELAKMPPIQMEDDGKFVFDRTLGLMRDVRTNRRITAGNATRVDGWIIRIVGVPKR